MTDLDPTAETLSELGDLGLDPRAQGRIEDGVRERLRAAGPVPRPSGARARRRIVPVAAALAVVGLVVLALLGRGATGERLDAVAAARAALSPSHAIVRMTFVTRRSAGHGAPPVTERTESWTASSPPRWHQRTFTTETRNYVQRHGHLVRVRGPYESSYAPTELQTYSRQFHELQILTHIPASTPTAQAHLGIQLTGNDPAANLRHQLDYGHLQDLGTVTGTGGRAVRRLRSITQLSRAVTETLTYDVDPKTFAPVAGSMTAHDTRPARNRAPRIDIALSFTVTSYELLPDTARNAHVLQIRVPTGTTTTRRRAILPHPRR